MSETNVSSLAKELDISVRELSVYLKDLGIDSKSDAVIDNDTVLMIKDLVKEQKESNKVKIPQALTVRELAEKLGVAANEVQKRLVELGILATVNQSVGADVAQKVAEKWNITLEIVKSQEVREQKAKAEKQGIQKAAKTNTKMVSRPPVVTVMGHVDHGKTTLLDALRKTHVTEHEFGGITQHIGAYQVELKDRKITFLDTPGHAAFTSMRARGASVTDIAILVVAADDAVMPQTIEAIHHAKAAGVPIVVAINKIDREDADPERCKTQLMEHGLMPEEWGGDTIMVEISAKQRTNLDELLEMVLLVADMEDLKAEVSTSKVLGAVVEAHIESGMGNVATVLIQRGTLKIGAAIVAGEVYGRVKAMFSDKGEKLIKAGPSTPVEIVGFNSAPQAGDILESVKTDKEARIIAEKRLNESKSERLSMSNKITLEDLYAQIQAGTVKKLPVVLRADVQGTLEAVKQSLEQIEHEEVKVDIIFSGIGNITENDLMFAITTGAIIVGFNTGVDPSVNKMPESDNVEIRQYNIIYELMKDVKAAMAGLLEPVYEEIVNGFAEVRAIFRIPNQGVVAGCYVPEGKVVRNDFIRIKRGDEVIYEGKLDSLKHVKDEKSEISQGFECGIMIKGFNDFAEGDIIESFSKKQIARAIN